MKRIVVIGGGTGVFTVLSGLRKYPYDLTAIVSMADDGGSTGVLREEFGTLPPGDIRRALVALSDSNNKVLSELFNYRFEEGKSFKGHSLGNLLLTALERITGSFDQAVKESVKILNVRGQVIPVTLSSTKLCAELENGKRIEGETNIDIPKHNGNLKISKIFLDPPVKANPEAIEAIKKADIVILGPGDLFTSILPNIIVDGVAEALKKTRAKVLYMVNIMTKFGETNDYKASDFLKKMEEYIGEGVIDFVFVNIEKPKGEATKRYKKENVDYVENDVKNNGKMKIVKGKFLRDGMFIRHDPDKLARKIHTIVGE